MPWTHIHSDGFQYLHADDTGCPLGSGGIKTIVPGSLADPSRDGHPANDYEAAYDGLEALLRLIGDDPTREGLIKTPARVIRAYLELAERPGNIDTILGTVFTDDIAYPPDQMIAVGPIEFVSMCEHHLLPFTGNAWVAYIPNGGGIVGLSKIPRVVDHYARRPQVQERLTAQIADALVDKLDPTGAACLIRATHSCMALRGVRKPNALMTTSVLRGAFKDDPTARAEFLSLTQ